MVRIISDFTLPGGTNINLYYFSISQKLLCQPAASWVVSQTFQDGRPMRKKLSCQTLGLPGPTIICRSGITLLRFPLMCSLTPTCKTKQRGSGNKAALAVLEFRIIYACNNITTVSCFKVITSITNFVSIVLRIKLYHNNQSVPLNCWTQASYRDATILCSLHFHLRFSVSVFVYRN